MKFIGINDRKWMREKYIIPLLASKLRLSIPEKPNSRRQKYYTEEGAFPPQVNGIFPPSHPLSRRDDAFPISDNFLRCLRSGGQDVGVLSGIKFTGRQQKSIDDVLLSSYC